MRWPTWQPIRNRRGRITIVRLELAPSAEPLQHFSRAWQTSSSHSARSSRPAPASASGCMHKPSKAKHVLLPDELDRACERTGSDPACLDQNLHTYRVASAHSHRSTTGTQSRKSVPSMRDPPPPLDIRRDHTKSREQNPSPEDAARPPRTQSHPVHDPAVVFRKQTDNRPSVLQTWFCLISSARHPEPVSRRSVMLPAPGSELQARLPLAFSYLMKCTIAWFVTRAAP
jgi:hypothetical protein